MRLAAAVVLVCLAQGLGGCALTSKSDPTLLRYYSLNTPRHRERSAAAPGAPLQLRVGRVNAASYIRDRIAFRSSGVEVGYYDDLMWTEKPEAYVRRDLARALFQDQGVQEIVGGMGPTLDVELDAFEELRERHVAVVILTWQLRDDTVVLLRQTVTVEHPLGDDPRRGAAQGVLAVALSEALDDAVDQLVRAVLPRLVAAPAPVAPALPVATRSAG